MPNGGSDCCGTCWHNLSNKGEAGYAHVKDPDPNFCKIRDLDIDDPGYTYCGNHFCRRPDGDPIPIGPVFVQAKHDSREIWRQPPDSEVIRIHLLELLRELGEVVLLQYPLGTHTMETVIFQLGKFRDLRAIADLERIVESGIITPQQASGWLSRTLVAAANEALAKIKEP